MEKIETSHRQKWYSLVNVIAGVLISLIGLLVKALELGNVVLADMYIQYILSIFIIYVILRLPVMLDQFFGLYFKYWPPDKKEPKIV